MVQPSTVLAGAILTLSPLLVLFMLLNFPINGVDDDSNESHETVTIPAKRFSIQLDEPASTRWNKVIEDQKELLILFVKFIKWKIGGIPKNIKDYAQFLRSGKLGKEFQELADELYGISEFVKGGVSYEDMVFLNVFYEYLHGCTAIVAQDSEGSMWLGRNLDYFFKIAFGFDTVILDFKMKDKVVYTGTTFNGYTGLLTGQKPLSFGFALNQRGTDDPPPSFTNKRTHINPKEDVFFQNQLKKLVTVNLTTVAPIGFTMRVMLEKAGSFDEAIIYANSTKTIPAYVTFVGVKPGQGAVLSKDKGGIWTLRDANSWFLVETNYDHWKPAGDNRRNATIEHMLALGQDHLNFDSLKGILFTTPTWRFFATIYTTVMNPKQPDLYQTWVF